VAKPSPKGRWLPWAPVVLFGLVSLFADVVYEGARAITGPYLALLGAASWAVGVSSGLGEFAGYSLRLLTGILADRTGRYWTFTFLGYFVNLGAVPALALAGRWEWAAALVVLERFGKALRTPARDALLAQATEATGHGKGFGLHELLDQVGAVLGPLLVAGLLARQGSMPLAFLLLGIPGLAALATLGLARAFFPQTRQAPGKKGAAPLPSRLPWVMGFVALHLAGFAHFQLVAFHCQKEGLFAPATIPLLFALAMGVDGLVALPAGLLFDRLGLASLAFAPLLALPVPALVFSLNPGAVALGVGLWGAALSLQETICKAAVAAASPPTQKASAFGAFHFVSGLAWLAGGSLLGALYPLGPAPLAVASALGQGAALLVLVLALKGKKQP